MFIVTEYAALKISDVLQYVNIYHNIHLRKKDLQQMKKYFLRSNMMFFDQISSRTDY